ncbi:Lysophosphatidylcholine acyltransferase [Giardia muris]|uniref:Lysophosphatidylcholine acyltransferase n=1 Tax=Giardia muris TaxID=5742 RepID=A0A4Z1STX4_GIAMU|nr:Lysophosphatidylcholine acyltransferase [Giardia muris]|eukprot:TNJ29314.1 Lysophosphatidylcholine acyltransferase [Giardia muris]
MKQVTKPNAFTPVRAPRTLYYYAIWFLQVLLAPILFPLRVILVLLIFTYSAIACRLFGWRIAFDSPINPMRRFLLNLTVIHQARAFLWAIGYRLVEKDLQNKPDRDTDLLLLYNHTTSVDGVVLTALGFTMHVSKSEVKRMPIFGKTQEIAQGIFVERSDEKERQRVKMEIQRRLDSRTIRAGLPREWPLLVMAPEGTTTNGTVLLPFHQGAFIPGVPINFAIITYDRRLVDISDSWQGMTWAVIKTMFCFSIRVTIRYLPQYTPNAEEVQDPKLYAQNVREYVAHHAGLPLCELHFQDKKYMKGNLDDITKCSKAFLDDFGEGFRLKDGWYTPLPSKIHNRR